MVMKVHAILTSGDVIRKRFEHENPTIAIERAFICAMAFEDRMRESGDVQKVFLLQDSRLLKYMDNVDTGWIDL
mgnify:FL=1